MLCGSTSKTRLSHTKLVATARNERNYADAVSRVRGECRWNYIAFNAPGRGFESRRPLHFVAQPPSGLFERKIWGRSSVDRAGSVSSIFVAADPAFGIWRKKQE